MTRMNRKTKIGIIVLACICLIALTIVVTWTVARAVGKKNLKENTLSDKPVMETPETIEAENTEQERWEEGWVKYNNRIYKYNDDIITFLFMGIDKDGKTKEVSEGTNGGQADALFLAVLNPHNQTIKIVGINRNTMADIDLYDSDGSYLATVQAQLAVQHGFGNGVEESCEYQVKAVSKFLYSLPIHGYAAINMKAVPIINDAVGGVDVVALSDVKNMSQKRIIKEGDLVHLTGDMAYWYVRDRNMGEFASADKRLDRQKQYLKEFVSKAKKGVKEDIGLVGELYNDITPYMTTNVTLDELIYLAPEMVNYSFDSNSVYMIKGETVKGEEFEEFYPDENQLYDLIINIFYEEVIF